MIALYIILIVAGAFPLIAFLFKRKEYFQLKRSGVKTTARVSNITTHKRTRGVGTNYDNIVYTYLPLNSNQYYSGVLMAKIDQYKIGDELEIYYQADKPEKKALAHIKYNVPGLLFVIAFFLAVVFACYKIYEMMNSR